MVGPSVLLQTANVEEPVTDADDMATSGPAAVVDTGNSMNTDNDIGVTSTCIGPLITNGSVSQTFVDCQVLTRCTLPQLCHQRRRRP
jgi:hypothetical protein